jgi:two-component system alkaline phosphatase synthesis response regulator PhoP
MEQSAGTEVLRAPGLEVHPEHYAVFADGRFLQLSPHELALLVALMRNFGRTIRREQLYELAWDGATLRDGDRSVDVFVRKLRVKLERALPSWRFIHTHFGLGYRFYPEPVEQSDRTVTSR